MLEKLKITDLNYDYNHDGTDKALRALRDINFSVTEGEFVSIVGPSGCGKSTLLSIIDGLIQATTGQVTVDGIEVTAPSRNRAMVFQDSSLLPWRNVLANIMYGLECHNINKTQARQRAIEMTRLVGLEGFENHYPHQLSGGMQQRVNLARALIINPEILLMDEPFAALDAQTRETMQDELLRIWRLSKKTVIFVTHQIDEAIFLSDRIIVLSSRPGNVKADILVSLERPRALSLKRTKEFHDLEDHMWQLIN
jgi:NitT/TauT family transport system ATP-binding protein